MHQDTLYQKNKEPMRAYWVALNSWMASYNGQHALTRQILRRLDASLQKAAYASNIANSLDRGAAYTGFNRKQSAGKLLHNYRLRNAIDTGLLITFARDIEGYRPLKQLNPHIDRIRRQAFRYFTQNKPLTAQSLKEEIRLITRITQSKADYAWMDTHLMEAIDTIPYQVLQNGGFGKLIHTMLGVMFFKLDILPDNNPNLDAHREDLIKTLKAAYFFGLTYPLVDDVMDTSGILSVKKKNRISELIADGLAGEYVPDSAIPNSEIARSLKYCFDSLKELFPPQKHRSLYDALLMLHLSQEEDRNKTFEKAYDEDVLYVPLIMKSAYTRLIPALIAQKPVTKTMFNYMVSLALVNQLIDDFRDIPEDLENKCITPFTYFLKNKNRMQLRNPLLLYFTNIEYIAAIQTNGKKIAHLLLIRFTHAIKLLKNKSIPEFFENLVADLDVPATIAHPIRSIAQKKHYVIDLETAMINRMTYLSAKETHKAPPDFTTYLKKHAKYINSYISDVSEKFNKQVSRLYKSMNYSLNIGGKRIRPVLAFMTADALGLDKKAILPFSCALEFFHTASLIFDDLPAQDNAALRRGKPANHVEWGEDTAQLAAISLIARSYEQIASLPYPAHLTQKVVLYMSQKLSDSGMTGGQALDLNPGNSPAHTLEDLEAIAMLKTGIAIEAAMVPVAMLAEANQPVIDKFSAYALHLGIAFQITDDLLDAESTPATTGKDTGLDRLNNKNTFVSLLGLSQARKRLNHHACKAEEALRELNFDTTLFSQLLHFVNHRKR